MIWTNILIYFLLAALMIPLVSYLGSKKVIYGYMGFTNYIIENKKDYYKWAEYWILLNPMLIITISFALYQIGATQFIRHVWMITPLYWWNLYFYIVVILGRRKLLNQVDFFVISLLSSIISYGVYKYIVLVGSDFILPNFENIRDLLWIGSLGYLFYILNKKKEEEAVDKTFYKRFLSNKLSQFRAEYNVLLDNLAIYELRNIALTIIFFEDFNRPKIIRKVEHFLSHLGLAKTTGISQLGKNANDIQSVEKLVKWLNSIAPGLNFENHWEYPRVIFEKYNGKEYADECWEIHELVKHL